MDAPWVTLITPSFNQGRFLRRTITSVLAQTYPRIEYAVFDGGSTDDSLAILREYSERLFWVSQKDGGQAAAINSGLRLARGAIVGYLNADDVLEPDAIATVVAAFQENWDWDLIYGNAQLIDADDQLIGVYETAAFSMERLRANCIICQPAAFWRRRLHDQFGYFDERLHAALDYDFWLRLAAAGRKFAFLPKVLAASRIHADTKTSRWRVRCLREAIGVLHANTGSAAAHHYHALWEERARRHSVLSPLRWHARIPRHCAWWHYRCDHEYHGSLLATAGAMALRLLRGRGAVTPASSN